MEREEFESLCLTIPPLICNLCGQEIPDDDDAVCENRDYYEGVEILYYHRYCHKEIRP